MSWSKWIRRFHRWVSMLFVLTVVAIFVTLGFAEPPMWLYYTPLPPLFLLILSGLYLFALPYLGRGRAVGG